MGILQHFHPLRQEEIYPLNRKFIENALQYMINVVLPELFTVYRQHSYPIFCRQFLGKLLALRAIRLLCIEKNDKRFADFLQRTDSFLLCRHITFSGQFGNRTVRSNDNPDIGMFTYYLLRANFRRLRKGNLVIKPGRLHHPLRTLFHMPACTLHHESHTVNEAHADL